MKATQVLQRSAAACMAGAAVVHLGVDGEHFAEWWLFGVFFLVLAALQVLLAVLSWQPVRRPMLISGMVVNLLVVALWAVTRTAGLPFGPDPGTAEAVGIPDVLTVVLELASVALAAVVLIRLRQSRPVRQLLPRTATAITAIVAAAVLLTSSVAIADPSRSQTMDDSMTGNHAVNHAGAGGCATPQLQQGKENMHKKGANHTMSRTSQDGTKADGNGERHQMAQLPDVSKATTAQTAAAKGLLAKTIADTKKYRDPAVAKAAGFDLDKAVQKHNKKRPNSVGKALKMLHVPNQANRSDGKVVNPAAPETLIYSRTAAGKFILIGVMYTAEKKDPPATYQPYLRWHFHEHCKVPGTKKPCMPTDGKCPEGSKLVKSGYMTHVWFVQPADLVYGYAMTPPVAQLKAYQETIR